MDARATRHISVDCLTVPAVPKGRRWIMNPRVSWHDLSSALRDQIEDQAGSFIAEEHVTTGFNCLALDR